MKGNQTIELTESQLMLIRAIDFHIDYGNCCGRLIPGKITIRRDKTSQIFHCSYCHDEIEISWDTDEKTN